MMKGLLNQALAALLLATGLIACNPSGNTAEAPGTDTVYIRQMQFQPAEIYINKWDTVVWINEDLVSHDVTAFPDKAWTSDTILPNASWKSVFGKNADYFCSVHPTMKGKVIIRE